MTLVELKARAYDLIAQIEAAQVALKEVNAKILQAMNPPAPEEKPEEPKEADALPS